MISDFIDLDQVASSRFSSRSKTKIVGCCSSAAMARVCNSDSEVIPEHWPRRPLFPPAAKERRTISGSTVRTLLRRATCC